MNNILLGLLSLLLIVASNAFARCPDPNDIYYQFGIHDNVPGWKSNDGQWTTFTENIIYNTDPPPANQKIDFVAVKVLTGNGENMPGSASPHVRCIYNVPGYQLIIMRPTSQRYFWTKIDKDSGWEYVSLENDKNFGEWRCSKSKDPEKPNPCIFDGVPNK